MVRLELAVVWFRGDKRLNQIIVMEVERQERYEKYIHVKTSFLTCVSSAFLAYCFFTFIVSKTVLYLRGLANNSIQLVLGII